MKLCCDTEFVVGRSYWPADRSYDPVTVISRTEKSIKVRSGSGSEFRMFIKKDHDGTETCKDSSVPLKWRRVFTYCADDPVS